MAPLLKSRFAWSVTILLALLVWAKYRLSSGPDPAHATHRQEVGEEIDRLFREYQDEKFVARSVWTSGWRMTLPSGRSVKRTTLDDQAVPIIAYGKEAVPHLFKWVRSDNIAVRYIATYSLEEITGISPEVYYLQKEDRAGNWEKAIRVWEAWLEEQQ